MQFEAMHLFYHQACNALWLAWGTYWCVAAIGAKRVRYRESVNSRLSHLAPMLVGIGLMVWPHPGFDWLTQRYLPETRTWFFAGLAFTAVGLGFSVYARGWLGRNWSTNPALKEDHELIRGGPYRWVRHPIYTGLLLAVLGSAMAQGEWRGLVGFVLITVSLLRKLAVEERLLTEQFGDAYRRFQAEVPALVPGVY
jgi:protein-S-isoprenylcysteine O-methyltransferase Ste14